MIELSIIIPTLNEEHILPKLFAALRQQQGVNMEWWVADGGSTDQTRQYATEQGAHVMLSEPGRGRQMNAAAQMASGRWLLFLHADSHLPNPGTLRDAIDTMQRAQSVHKHDHIAGHFPLRFTDTSPQNALRYRHLEAKTRTNRPYTINGDQGCLLSRGFFAKLGGYDESLPFLEDQRIAWAIEAHGFWVMLPHTLETSARRFETEGFLERYTIMAIIMGSEIAGFDEVLDQPETLYPLQHHTQRLDMVRFFSALQQKHRRLPWQRALSIWAKVGQFARQNAWQPFLYQDIKTNGKPGRWLQRYDQHIAERLDNPICDLLIGAAAYWVIMHYLPGRWSQ